MPPAVVGPATALVPVPLPPGMSLGCSNNLNIGCATASRGLWISCCPRPLLLLLEYSRRLCCASGCCRAPWLSALGSEPGRERTWELEDTRLFVRSGCCRRGFGRLVKPQTENAHNRSWLSGTRRNCGPSSRPASAYYQSVRAY